MLMNVHLNVIFSPIGNVYWASGWDGSAMEMQARTLQASRQEVQTCGVCCAFNCGEKSTEGRQVAQALILSLSERGNAQFQATSWFTKPQAYLLIVQHIYNRALMFFTGK